MNVTNDGRKKTAYTCSALPQRPPRIVRIGLSEESDDAFPYYGTEAVTFVMPTNRVDVVQNSFASVVTHKLSPVKAPMRSSGMQRWSSLLSLLVVLYELGAFAWVQARVTPIGIIGVRDESGANVSVQILQKIAGELQQDLNKVYKDTLLARTLNAESDRTVEQLTTLGKENGVSFVVRGGLLTLSPNTVQLYADVISVESGSVTTLRAEADSPDVDTALSAAIRRLSVSIHDLVISAAAVPARGAHPEDLPTVLPSDAAFAELETAETEEELWQLIAQAEALLGSPSAISSETLNAARQALEALNGALEAKAAIVADGRDSSEADRIIAARKQELQAALTAATEQTAAAQEVEAPYQEPSSQKKSLLTSLGESLAEATDILRQIQEIRAAWRGAREDQSAETGASTGNQEVLEEPFEEINGAVTEDSEPVEGVTVTDSESGETSTTDANGSYVLRVVPGKPSRLVLTRQGKRLTAGQVLVQRGRPAAADFELNPQVSSSSRRTLRVLPSTVVVKAGQAGSGSTGSLGGVVRDPEGRPLARALVSLRGVAVARTDSQGTYAFIGVPAGAHQLTVYRPGSKAQSRQVQVAARRKGQSEITLASSDPRAEQHERQSLRLRGAGTLLRGVVTSNERRPLRGAKVTLMRRTSAVSVLTDANGSYAFRDIEPAEYRTVVMKFGYGTEGNTLELRSGKTETRNFTLRKSSSPVPGTVLTTSPTRDVAGSRAVPRIEPEKPRSGNERSSAIAPLRSATGGVRGQVLDAKTGKPVAGATISIPGARGVETNHAGSYAVINVPAGVYPVVVKRNGYADGRANLTIRAGETATFNVRLNPRPTMQIRPKAP